MNLLSKEQYENIEPWFEKFARSETVKSGVGVFLRGQVFAMDFATGKMVKYVDGASDGTEIVVSVAKEGGDATSSDVAVAMLKLGRIPKDELVGIDVLNGLSGFAAVTALNAAAGSLTDATTYNYKIQGANKAGLFAVGTADEELTATPNLSITITFELPIDVTSARLWRTDDAGTTYEYVDLSVAELAAGSYTDDGTVSFTASSVPVTVDDEEGIQTMERSGIFLEGSTEGYNVNCK